MVIDTSAFVCMALGESDSSELLRASAGYTCSMAAPSLLECHLVLKSRLGDESQALINLVLNMLSCQIVPFDLGHARVASEAFDMFGKGRHPASLNFGDCMTYALAKVSGQPLLFVGEDFGQTDVQAVPWRKA